MHENNGLFMTCLSYHIFDKTNDFFSGAFPGISSPSADPDITLCDVTPSTTVTHIRCTLSPS